MALVKRNALHMEKVAIWDITPNALHMEKVAIWDITPNTHLVEQRIQHTDTEHSACSERQTEHEGQVGTLITLYL